MKYAGKEVISDSEAKRFARNLCKKREKFPCFDDALSFVFTIRKVVSDSYASCEPMLTPPSRPVHGA